MPKLPKHLTPDVVEDLKRRAATNGDHLILFKGISIMVATTYVDSAIFGLATGAMDLRHVYVTRAGLDGWGAGLTA